MLRSWKKPISLEISEDGFKILANPIFKKEVNLLMSWADIEGFNLLKTGFVTYVTYQVTKESGRKRAMGGYTIPIIFEADAEEVAMLLEGIRQASLTQRISGIGLSK